ncbi:MAG: DUF4923 family protein [Prevotella sp.]|nr:DUF4923 family protein [Prevotella sp.]
MKKLNIIATGLFSLATISCGSIGTAALGSVLGAATGTTGTSNTGTDILGGVIGAVTNGDALGNILGSVLGTDKMTQERLYGTWKYSQPGVAFTSDQLLAKAGGEVAASQAKEKLKSYYTSVGITSANTVVTFNEDMTFTATIAGKSLSGTYTYDQSAGQVTMKTLLFTLPCYVKGSTTGMSLLFESKKLLTLLQTAAAISGNSTLNTVGDISKNYDGIRLGFDMSK